MSKSPPVENVPEGAAAAVSGARGCDKWRGAVESFS